VTAGARADYTWPVDGLSLRCPVGQWFDALVDDGVRQAVLLAVKDFGEAVEHVAL